jgi:predicted DNA-binding protein with PD1-like motif
MKAKVIEDADDVTYVVVCDPGDEAFDVLTQFARAQDLKRHRSLPSAPSPAPPSAGSTP